MKKAFVFGIAVIMSITAAFTNVNRVCGDSTISSTYHTFSVDSKNIDVKALNIDGSNYVKISELAELLDIDISFDEKTKAVGLDKTEPFCGVRVIKEIILPRVTFLPETSPKNDVGADTSSVAVYENRIYVQVRAYDSRWYRAGNNKAIAGDYLGKASGIIYGDLWEPEYGLRSNVEGDVYSVKGYDKNFRICITSDDTEGALLLQNLNEITVKTGSDIFSDRLHLKENYRDVDYQTHGDWSEGELNYQKLLGFTTQDYDFFIDKLNQSGFVEVGGDVNGYSRTDGTELLNSDSRKHLHFKMNDGTTVTLALYEGGYVGYYGLVGANHSVVLVKMNPNGVFKKFFEQTGH